MLSLRPLATLLSLMTVTGSLCASGAALQDEKQDVGFAHPQLLVSTSWLAVHGRDKGVVVVDVRKSGDHAAAHVTGSVNIPAPATSDPDSRWSLGSAKHIAKLLGAQGIDAKSHVVLYDEGRSTAAPRVFWALEVYGHAKVSVVDGGFAKWKSEQRPATVEATRVTAIEYKIGKRSARVSTGKQVLADVEQADAAMLDARTSREYTSGRIPGAVRIEWTENYTSDKVAVFKSPADLRKLYADQGVTRDKRVHAY